MAARIAPVTSHTLVTAVAIERPNAIQADSRIWGSVPRWFLTTTRVVAATMAEKPEKTPDQRFAESRHQATSSASPGSCGTSMEATVRKRKTPKRAAATAATRLWVMVMAPGWRRMRYAASGPLPEPGSVPALTRQPRRRLTRA